MTTKTSKGCDSILKLELSCVKLKNIFKIIHREANI